LNTPIEVFGNIERHQIESHKSRDLPDDLAGNVLQGVVPQRFLYLDSGIQIVFDLVMFDSSMTIYTLDLEIPIASQWF